MFSMAHASVANCIAQTFLAVLYGHVTNQYVPSVAIVTIPLNKANISKASKKQHTSNKAGNRRRRRNSDGIGASTRTASRTCLHCQ